MPKESVSGGLPADMPGSLYVRGTNGGIRVAPDAGFDVVFGRCEPDVHVCVGLDDPYVSSTARIHHLRERAMGPVQPRQPAHPPSGRAAGAHRTPRAAAGGPHTAVHRRPPAGAPVRNTDRHGIAPGDAGPPQEADTRDPNGWPLSTVERLVLVCLGQRYLRPEPWPQPLTWAQVADELGRLRPADKWTAKRAAHIVTQTRKRLSAKVPGLLEEEIPPPLGNTLNHNLIMALLVSATIGPSDLRLLDEPASPPPGTVDPIP
ncbi:hypothetical protein ACFSTC_60010 [Nonomuraea ferruginea]